MERRGAGDTRDVARVWCSLLALRRAYLRWLTKREKKSRSVLQATLAGDEIGPPALPAQITLPRASQ